MNVIEQLEVNAENPWVGLHEFTESIHTFFYGRGRETDDLLRMVRNKTLTVLFGQSGLGKSSLLQAGLFPKLRAEDFLPVRIRLNYKDAGSGREVPTLRAQVLGFLRRAVKDAVARGELASAKEGGLPPEPLDNESLWEYLHRRERPLRRLDGRPVIPVLAFDQFEEIFTVGRNSRVGQEGERPFLRTMAECIENRIPKKISEKRSRRNALDGLDIEADDYRIIFSLREDYVAYLDDLGELMPSIMENRMRLLPLNGRQAIEAVIKPGGKLVKPSVARRIVRFAAASKRDGLKSEALDKKSDDEPDLAELQVDPALLSMICCELNKSRRRAGLTEITTELLKASSQRILQDFYQACFKRPEMQPVRVFVEEELLTSSDYRDSIECERARCELEKRGVSNPAQAIEMLVKQRLLRVVEGGADGEPERIELTHDLLTTVVSESRRIRRQEQHEAKVLAAAERRRKEVEKRLREARRRQAVYATLLLLAMSAIAFGMYAKWKAAEDKRMASKDNFQYAKLLLTEKSKEDSSDDDAEQGTATSSTRLIEPKGRIFALIHLAKALEYNPDNSAASKLLCKMLSKHAWCPPLTSVMRTINPQNETDAVIQAATWAPDGSVVALTESGELVRHDPKTNEWQSIGKLECPTGKISSAFFSEDGQLLIALTKNVAGGEAYHQAHVLEWDGKASYATAQEPLKLVDGDSIQSATWSPNKEWLILISRSSGKNYLFKRGDNGLRIDDQWKELNEGGIRCAVFINKGAWVATAHRNGEVRIWEVGAPSFKTLGSLSYDFGRVWRMKANPRRPEFLTVSGEARIIRIEPSQKIESSRVITIPRVDSNDRIIRAVFSCDGKRVATGTMGGLVQLWDAQKATAGKNSQLSKRLAEPMFHHGGMFRGGMVLDLLFSPDCNSLITMAGISFSQMNSMQIWDIRPHSLSQDPFVLNDTTPEWLRKLAEAVSGTRLTLHGYEPTSAGALDRAFYSRGSHAGPAIFQVSVTGSSASTASSMRTPRQSVANRWLASVAKEP